MRIETTPIATAELPVGEQLQIRRTRLVPGAAQPAPAAAPGSPAAPAPQVGRRLCVVTGTHGDELEGQYVAYEVIRRIRENPEALAGTVDVYPALNPLGIDSIKRGIPNFDLDLNRLFPGNPDGCMPERYAREVVDDLSGADMVVDIHASNIFLYEIPQIRVNELTVDRLLDPARQANVDFVWVHGAATVLEATLAYSLNSTGTPCLVVEAGIGMRLTKAYGDQIADGLFNLMARMGIWRGPVAPVRSPRVSTDGQVHFVNAGAPGIFMPTAGHTDHVERGEVIGNILDPQTGTVAQELRSPCTGLMFTLRAYPVVYEGSLIARILADTTDAEGEAGR